MHEGTSERIVEAFEPIRLPVVRPRVGVVLAAGRSQRLSQLTRDGSKALIPLGGMSSWSAPSVGSWPADSSRWWWSSATRPARWGPS